MSTAVLVIWGVTLLIIALVIVPLAIHLLSRTLTAARSIERYLAEMLEAGVGVAGNTAAIPALDETIKTAQAALGVAPQLERHSAEIATILADRAAAGDAR